MTVRFRCVVVSGQAVAKGWGPGGSGLAASGCTQLKPRWDLTREVSPWKASRSFFIASGTTLV